MNNVIKAVEAHYLFKKYDEEYNKGCKRFSVKDKNDFDVQAFKEFVFNNIRTNAENGCSDFEFEVNVDLNELGVVEYFKLLDYQVSFYKLNKDYSDNGYNLLISWRETFMYSSAVE